MALVTAGERANNASPDVLFNTMTAYPGRYQMRGEETFVTKVNSAWHPGWIGTEQDRHFRLNTNILSIFSPPQEHPKFPGQRVRGIAIWQKEEALF